jgi:transcription-repair coupling factor (superfamily II helicase)|tara:strand:- start:651 stop:833 length:183 start_codon:yes stop_codon:yes gene_type:complete
MDTLIIGGVKYTVDEDPIFDQVKHLLEQTKQSIIWAETDDQLESIDEIIDDIEDLVDSID